MKQIFGIKVGMVSLFDEKGKLHAGTVVKCEPNKVLELKGTEKHNWNLVKVGFVPKNEKKLNKSQSGIFKKANSETMTYVRTLKSSNTYNVGDEIKVDTFTLGEWVDVQGVTKGRGFTGSIYRWNKKVGPLSHGHGYLHRWQGSLAFGRGGSSAQRVKLGTHMAGHYGHELQTIQNQNVLAVDLANNLLIITGAIPGPTGSVVTIKEAIKPHKKNLEFKIINKKLQAEIEAMNKKIEEDKESLHAAAMAEKAEEKKGGAK